MSIPPQKRRWRVYEVPEVLRRSARWTYTTSPLIRYSRNLPFLELCLPRSRKERAAYTPYLKMYSLLRAGDGAQFTPQQRRLLIDLYMAGIRARDWTAANSLRYCLYSSRQQVFLRRTISRVFGALILALLNLVCYHQSPEPGLYSDFHTGHYVALFPLFWVLYLGLLLIDDTTLYYRPPEWLPEMPDEEEEEAAKEEDRRETIIGSIKSLAKGTLGCLFAIVLVGVVLALIVGIFLGGGYLLYLLIRHFLPPMGMVPLLVALTAWAWWRQDKVRRWLRERKGESIRGRLADAERAYHQYIQELMEDSASWETE